MCYNKKYIYNRYSKQKLYVSCGHCPACKQQKASARAARIRSNCQDGYITLFVTLTYKKEFVPYIHFSRLSHRTTNVDVPVYRHCTGRFVRYGRKTSYRQIFKTDSYDNFGRIIDYLPSLRIDNHDGWLVKPLKKCYAQDEIGICYYPDLQNFFKRLRQILKRNFNFNDKFTYFACSEYGSSSHRPHFHLLISVPSTSEQIFRMAILKAWPYADYNRTAKFIEVARDAASYVASYVNGGSMLPQALSDAYTRQKHSYSQGYGMGLSSFSISSILEKIDRRNMLYCRRVRFDGKESFVNVPVPEYVINRYFPKFKGYSRCSSDSVYRILLCSLLKGSGGYTTGEFFPVPELNTVLFSDEDCHKISVRFQHCYQMFHDVTGKSVYDYISYYQRCWDLIKSYRLKMSHYGKSPDDYKEFYVNIPFDVSSDFVPEAVGNLMYDYDFVIDDLNNDPCLFKENIELTEFYTEQYIKRCKLKHITNSIMVAMDLDV